MPAKDDITSRVEYRTIERFLGYRFGSDGSVWSCHRRGHRMLGILWRQLKQRTYDKYGHRCVGISQDGVGKRILSHRLIAEAFHGPCPEGMQCRHLNGDAWDNRPGNLRWGTSSENSYDTVRHGRCPAQNGKALKGEMNGRALLSEADVKQIRALRASGMACVKIALMFGVCRSNVSMIVTRRNWRLTE